MGYNIFETVKLKQSFRKKLKSFVATLGSAITKGNKISFADNDISYVSNEQYNISRKITRDGKIRSRKEKYRAVFIRITDIPIDMRFSMTRIQCPNCGGSFNAVQNRICPFCGRSYDIESQDWILNKLYRE